MSASNPSSDLGDAILDDASRLEYAEERCEILARENERQRKALHQIAVFAIKAMPRSCRTESPSTPPGDLGEGGQRRWDGGAESREVALSRRVEELEAEKKRLQETIGRMDRAALGALDRVGAFEGHDGTRGIVFGIERLANQRNEARALLKDGER